MISSSQFERFLSSFDDVIFIMDFPSLVFKYISPSIEKLRGYTPEEVYSNPDILLSNIYQMPKEQIVEVFMKYLDKGSVNFEYPMATKSGEIKWHSTSFSLITTEEGECMLSGIIHDLTKQKNTAIELEKLKAEYEDLYNNAPSGYHSLNADGVITRINDTELKWLGYERKELVGKPIYEFLFTPASQKVYSINFPKLKKHGIVTDLRMEMIRKDGSILPVLVNATAIADEKGELQYTRSMVTDITTLKAAEEELWRSQKALEIINQELWQSNQKLERLNFTKDVLLKIISHDLRNPLETIKLISGLLHEKFEELDAETILKYVEFIGESGHHATDILDDMTSMLSLSNGVQLNITETIVLPVLLEAINLNKRRALDKQVQLHLASNTSELESIKILADPKWLARAVDNLITNALKFSNQGGEISIGCHPETKHAVLTVSDIGIGIPADILPSLFDRIGVASRQGTAGELGSGLGLTIVRQIIEMQNGQVGVQSEEGVGSCFYIKLPLA